MQVGDARTIAFFPEPGAWSPTNNCIAIAEVLRGRGQRVVFVVDSSFEGLLEAKGFGERAMRMAPPQEDADPTADPGPSSSASRRRSSASRRSSSQATVTPPIWEALVAGVRYSHHRLMEI